MKIFLVGWGIIQVGFRFRHQDFRYGNGHGGKQQGEVNLVFLHVLLLQVKDIEDDEKGEQKVGEILLIPF